MRSDGFSRPLAVALGIALATALFRIRWQLSALSSAQSAGNKAAICGDNTCMAVVGGRCHAFS